MVGAPQDESPAEASRLPGEFDVGKRQVESRKPGVVVLVNGPVLKGLVKAQAQVNGFCAKQAHLAGSNFVGFRNQSLQTVWANYLQELLPGRESEQMTAG